MGLTFLDFFAGVGGFRKGMEMADHKCLGHCEWDKYANMSYAAIHEPKEDEWFGTDIRNVRANELPRADCWCFGFPCQDISVAGKQLGFNGNRSSLFFTVTRLIRDTEEKDRPSILFIENVKNLLSVNGGADFLKLLIELDEIGYDAEWQVLNSKNFRVPQNRERVFIIGHFRGRSGRKIFPIGGSSQEIGIDVIRTTKSDTAKGTNCRSWVNNPNGINGALTSTDYKQPKQILVGNVNESGNGMSGLVYDSIGLSPTITTRLAGNKILIRENTKKGYVEAYEGDGIRLDHIGGNTGRARTQQGISNTLTTQGLNGVIIWGGLQKHQTPRKDGISPCLTSAMGMGGGQTPVFTQGFRIRKLTPKECWRLQGWKDEDFEKAARVCSDSQLYKQAGNGVTVNVIYEIAKRLA